METKVKKPSSVNLKNISVKVDKNAIDYEDFNAIIGKKPSLDKGIELGGAESENDTKHKNQKL